MSTRRSASATVTITVLDINDHIPTFDQALYVVNVSELAMVNSSVADLTAIDRDQVKHCNFSLCLYYYGLDFRMHMGNLCSPWSMSLKIHYLLMSLHKLSKTLELQKSS